MSRAKQYRIPIVLDHGRLCLAGTDVEINVKILSKKRGFNGFTFDGSKARTRYAGGWLVGKKVYPLSAKITFPRFVLATGVWFKQGTRP